MHRLLLCMLVMLLAPGLTQAADEAPLYRIPWGKGPAAVGLRFPEPGMLPSTPFLGPGGFRIDTDGALWVSDSVNRRIKRFAPGQPVRAFPVRAAGLGDLEVTAEEVYVVQRGPFGVARYEKASGDLKTVVAIPYRTPGRLRVIASTTLLLKEEGSRLWTVVNGKPVAHPAEALEPVYNGTHLFGVQYEFLDDSRRLLACRLEYRPAEPDQFTLFQTPGRRIVFNRLAGIRDGRPVLLVLFADRPDQFEVYSFTANGRPDLSGTLPVLPGCGLAAPWILGPDGNWYGLSPDLKGFSILRREF